MRLQKSSLDPHCAPTPPDRQQNTCGRRLSRGCRRIAGCCRSRQTGLSVLADQHTMIRRDDAGLPVIERRPKGPYERRLIQLAFLDPDIQRDILMGSQPRSITLATFLKEPLPLLWSGQNAVFR